MKTQKSVTLALLMLLGISTSIHAASSTEWGYSGSTGPEFWASLNPDEFALCGDGTEQSPIDLSSSMSADMGELHFDYQDVPLAIENNGHTIEVHYHAHGELRIEDKEYNLLQFHFHSPSEHTEDSTAAPMEMHLVHVNSDGQLAVVGVLIDEGEENEFFEQIISQAPDTETTLEIEGQTINAVDLLPSDSDEYRAYAGSLTTPPCSEGVSWYVLEERIEFSAEQIEQFLDIIGENARPTQDPNDRTVYDND